MGSPASLEAETANLRDKLANWEHSIEQNLFEQQKAGSGTEADKIGKRVDHAISKLEEVKKKLASLEQHKSVSFLEQKVPAHSSGLFLDKKHSKIEYQKDPQTQRHNIGIFVESETKGRKSFALNPNIEVYTGHAMESFVTACCPNNAALDSNTVEHELELHRLMTFFDLTMLRNAIVECNTINTRAPNNSEKCIINKDCTPPLPVF